MNRKKYIVLCLIVSNFLLLQSAQLGKKIVISLGHQCDTALQLRNSVVKHYGLRARAYPFDWIISPFNALFRCLEENFNNFLNPRYLELYSHMPNATGIKDNYYGFRFVHDFSTDYYSAPEDPFRAMVVTELAPHIGPIREKYKRRVERFRRTLAGKDSIVFIRTVITKEQALRLQKLIATKYPSLDFMIVAIDITPEMKTDWNIPGIKNYYVPDRWEIGSDDWTRIFNDIGLLQDQIP